MPRGTLRSATVVASILLWLLPVCAMGQAPRNAVAADSRADSGAGGPTIFGQWNMPPGAGQSGYGIEFGFNADHAQVLGVPSTHNSVVVDPPDGKIPLQPWAQAFRQQRWDISEDYARMKSKDLDTNTKCYPSGLPHVMYRDGPLITRFPDFVLIQFEWGHQFRVIYTDGRPHLPKSITLWFGDSRGRWEGITLVVETTNLNGYAWLDVIGDFYSDEARIEERFTPIDANTMRWRATMIDPHVFTRPWTIGWNYTRRQTGFATPGTTNTTLVGADIVPSEIWEHACNEGNRAPVWEQIYQRELVQAR